NPPGIARLAAFRPGADAFRPAIQRFLGIAAHVKLLVAVQAQIHEVSGDVLTIRPLACRVGDDERDAMAPQLSNEALVNEAFVTDLHGVAKLPVAVNAEPAAPGHASVALSRDRLRPLERPRQ